MKIVKKVLIVIAVLVAIPLVAAIFIPKDYAVERSISVSKPVHIVYDYLRHLKNQDHYNVWVRMDPAMEKRYTGTDGTIGFISAWNSKDENVGSGEQEIVKLTEDKEVISQMRFKEPFENIAYTHMFTEQVSSNETVVRLGMQGKSPYPFNVMNLFMNNLLGGDLSASLAMLKNTLEAQ
jgi:hypothetical protein